MRIIHLINYFQSKLGYQEFYLAKYQQKFGHKVLVVTADRYYPFPDYEQNYYNLLGDRFVGIGRKREEGIEIARLPIFLEYKKSSQVILRGVLSVFREFKPDIVHCHTLLSPISLQAVLGKRRLGYKLIFDSHVADFNTNINRTYLARLYKLFFLKTIIIPQIKKYSNGIFAIAEPEREFLVKYFGFAKNEIEIFPLGVDTGIFRPLISTRNRVREKMRLNRDDILVIFAGKITPVKEIESLIKAVSLLKNSKVKIALVGGADRNYLNILKNTSSGLKVSLWLIGLVPQKEVVAYYNAADIAVWPGDPAISMLEAMATGLPLIIPRWSATDYLSRSEGVLFFTRGDSLSLSRKLQELVENEEKRKKIGEKGKKYMENNQSWPIITEKILNFYKKS